MNFCPNCGAKLVGRFCAICGTDTEGLDDKREASAPVSDVTETQSSPPDSTPTPPPIIKEKKPLPKWMQRSLTWCKTTFSPLYTYCRTHVKQVGLVSGGAVAALALAIVIIVNMNNIFRAGRVDNIDLGFTKEQVADTLGKPDDEGATTWEWYSGKYGRNMRKIAKLEKKIENLDITEDTDADKLLEKIEKWETEALELEMELETLEHHRITVKFDDEDRVTSVVLDKDYIEMSEVEEVHEVQKTKSTLKHLPLGVSFGNIKTGARAWYKGGDYRMDYIRITNRDPDIDIFTEGKYLAKFSNSWGECSMMVKIKHGVAKGTILYGYSNGISCELLAEKNHFDGSTAFTLTLTGNGQVSKEGLASFYESVCLFDRRDMYEDILNSMHVSAVIDPTYGLAPLKYAKTFYIATTAFLRGMQLLFATPDLNYGHVTSIHIGAGVTGLGDRTFSCISGVKKLTVDEGNPSLYSVNNCIIDKATRTVVQGCSKSKLPQDGSILAIGDYAFADTGIKKIKIPDGVTTIGAYAFKNSKIWSITFPESVTYIGEYSFTTYRLTDGSFTSRFSNSLFERVLDTLIGDDLFSARFKNESGWCRDGVPVDVSDSRSNASYLSGGSTLTRSDN